MAYQPPYQPPPGGGQPPQYPQPQQPYYPQQPQPQQNPYGYQQPQQPYYAAPHQSNGIAVAGGVVGIIALVTAFIPFIDFVSIVLGILAIIFGAVGNGRAARMGGQSRGMAITGIVCGIIAVAISVLFIIAVYSTYYSVRSF
jgi:hypothetical protein